MKIKYFIVPIYLMIACNSPSKQNLNNEMENREQEVFYQAKPFTTGGEFTSGIEGPAVDDFGNLYVVNVFREGTIGKVTPKGEVSLFIELPVGSTGNGIRFNSNGEMLIADYTGHNVLQVDMNTLEINVYAHHPELNQPNDIAIMDNDIVFASDPSWKNGTGNLWRVDVSGEFVLLESSMGTTNGVEVSPDNKTLYVNESVQRNVWAYDLSPKGEISNKRLLIQFEDFGMDGMRCDTAGNLYITRHGKGTVAKISPDGELLQEIVMSGSKPSNIAFGGIDGKTAYVTLQDNGNIDSFRIEFPGRAFRKKG
ncbi:SMP-30/gluconolactonase/LRE family protein [Lunatibacter salilacus]|uniref:SMP-30/gluconolactonase/LRE family protein n=1 Tax=Lunatibacter salilacus TaxID=2483804 RepID=UPI0018FE8ED0|nr:SMP-30/gluconolactonase/LRE family protein [Lunatibacter salilacus]